MLPFGNVINISSFLGDFFGSCHAKIGCVLFMCYLGLWKMGCCVLSLSMEGFVGVCSLGIWKDRLCVILFYG